MSAALLGALALAAAAMAQDGPPRGGGFGPYADVSAVIGAEVSFNQLAQAKGQWTAFREMAAPEAILFVPEPVNARTWLKGRANPPTAMRWQPHAVWMSCDGSYAVTRGAWQQRAGTGVFVTVWQRQPKGAGYKWVIDLGDRRADAIEAPEMIAGKVAACPPRSAMGPPPSSEPRGKPHGRGRGEPALPPLPDPARGRSADDTMRWTAQIDAHGAGTLRVETRQPDGSYQTVVDETIKPQT